MVGRGIMKKPKTWVLALLTALVLTVSAVLSLVIYRGGAEYAEIYDGGTLVGRYPLDTERTIKLSHNTVRIEGGKVYMLESDCKNQICVNTGAISSPIYPIVCLPNHVMIRVSGDIVADAAAGD